MKRLTTFFFIMLALTSCNIKQDTVVSAANTPGNGVGPGSSGPTTDTRIFDQGFELSDDLYVSFNDCSYGEYCEILINYNPDPVFITSEFGGVPYEDTSIQMICVGDVLVGSDNTLTISDSEGNKPECANYNGDYIYTVDDCSLVNFTQKNWLCGGPGYPNALRLQQI
jgi:hypothetical protein